MTDPGGIRLVKYAAAVMALIGPSVVIVAAVVPAGAAPAAEERPAVARLIAAAVEISPPLARLEAGLQMVPRGCVLTDEGRLRPAAELGSWARSRGCRRVSPELGDALAEGSAPDATTRDWTRCYERGNGSAVICPDGYVEVTQATRTGLSGRGRTLSRPRRTDGARTCKIQDERRSWCRVGGEESWRISPERRASPAGAVNRDWTKPR